MTLRIDELSTLAEWLASGHTASLATVVATWGSAPRPVGSLLAVRDDGRFQGSVSGGCVEAAVIVEALAALEDGRMRDLTFGVSNDDAFAVGLACGGTMRIHVQPFLSTSDLAARLFALHAARKPFARIVGMSEDGWMLSEDPRDTDSGVVDIDGREHFRHVVLPPTRLIVVGAVHIAQYLAAMAEMADYEVTLVDPRTAFATAERFGTSKLVTDWPADVLRALAPDGQTAVVTLTHDPKLDDPALEAALRSDAFYIAALGSRKTHAARCARLAASGFDETALLRIHAPAGLAIGARSPAEIAISVLAELTATRRMVRTST